MAKYSRTNLIINYLPQAFSDEEFRALFSSVAPVKRAKVCRDKRSGYSFGFGFCEFYTAEDATRAVRALDGLQLHRKTIKVAHARLQSAESKNCNLHITNLPAAVTAEEIRAVLEPHGGIINCKILPGASRGGGGGGGGNSRGVGFCLFETRSAAASALAALNGKPWPGAAEAPDTSPQQQQLVQVRFADENEKKVRPPVMASTVSSTSIAPPLPPPPPLPPHLSLPLTLAPQPLPPPPPPPPLLSQAFDFSGANCFYAMQQHGVPPLPPPPQPPLPYGYPAYSGLAGFPPPQFYLPELQQQQPAFVVCVCNLPPSTDERQLWSMFAQFGSLAEVRLEPSSSRQPVPAEGDLQPPGATATVAFAAYQSAAGAAAQWNGQTIGGRQVQAWLRLP